MINYVWCKWWHDLWMFMLLPYSMYFTTVLQCFISKERTQGYDISLKGKEMWYYNLPSGPSLHLPMDVIGTGGALTGSIVGTVTGGASLVPGKHGRALSLDGIDGVVGFGMHPNKCFCFPEKCTTGSTHAYWVRYRTPNNFAAVILDTGGLHSPSHGYSSYIDKHGIMVVLAIDLTQEYMLEAYIGNPNHWLFVAHTWSKSSG